MRQMSQGIASTPRRERETLRNFSWRAQGKLAPRWGPERFVIVAPLFPDDPVYRIRPEGQDGPERHHLRTCPYPVVPWVLAPQKTPAPTEPPGEVPERVQEPRSQPKPRGEMPERVPAPRSQPDPPGEVHERVDQTNPTQ